jgi:hypothetical protein
MEKVFVNLVYFRNNFFKEVARGGEQTRVLSISFIFSFFTTFIAEPQRLPGNHLYIWYILRSFGIIHLPILIMLYQEKSGNPLPDSQIYSKWETADSIRLLRF